MGEESRNVLLQACSIDRAFHAQHPLVDLDLITDMATADHPAWSPAEGGIQKGAGEGIKSAEIAELSRTPGATDLSTDIKATVASMAEGVGDSRIRLISSPAVSIMIR